MDVILISKSFLKILTEPLQSLLMSEKLADLCWVEAWAEIAKR